MTLRAHLLALLAGETQKPRGNALQPAALKSSAPFATACQRMVLNAYRRDTADRVPAPSESLPPLP